MEKKNKKYLIDQLIIIGCLDNEFKKTDELQIMQQIPNILNKNLKTSIFKLEELLEVS